MDGKTPNPPRAALAFRVGGVGHRPDRLPNEAAHLEGLAGRVGFVLDAVKRAVARFQAEGAAGLYRDEPARLRAVTPLAEGFDQMFAGAALDAGYALVAPMPFPLAEFEADFAGGADVPGSSAATFHALQARAEAAGGFRRFELDGVRDDEEAAYAAAGRVVANQADLLVAVWDGGAPKGRGGTLETLRDALQQETPALWIAAWAPFPWRLLRGPADLDRLESEVRVSQRRRRELAAQGDDAALEAAVVEIVRAELAAPGVPAASAEAVARARGWFAERQPRFDAFVLWRLFRGLVGEGRLTSLRLRVAPFFASPAREWRAEDEGAGPAVAALWPHFAFADGLADHFANAHRSAFIATSLLAAAAVFAALAPVALGVVSGPHAGTDLAFIFAEVVILAVLGASLMAARRSRWHERWLEYRMLAEWIRQLRFLIPLGGGRPLPKSQAHLAVYGDPKDTWMYWQVRAIARDVGLPDALCDTAYVRARLEDLRAVIGNENAGQVGFHALNAARSQRIHDRLRRATSALVAITLAAIAVEFALRIAPPGPLAAMGARLGGWFVLVGAGLPALGAALAGINNLGEFAHTAKRSRALAQAFSRLGETAAALERRSQPPRSGEVAALAAEMAAIMVEEGADWRVVMLEQPHAAG